MRWISLAATSLLCVVPALVAHSAVISVEKDGSGDFTVIQDAVDAASDGDTIEIGPGRYADFFDAPYNIKTVVWAEDKSLSFVGAGSDLTIIGPENFGDIEGHEVFGIFVYSATAALSSTFSDMTFEHVQRYGIRIDSPGRAEIDRCRFRGSSGGFYGKLADGGWIRDCQFIDLDTVYNGHSVLFYTPTSGVVVENCEFRDCDFGVGSYWSGCTDIEIVRCTFENAFIGVKAVDGASSTVRECSFWGQSRYAIVGASAGSLIIEDNHVDMSSSDGLCVCVYVPPGDYYLRNNTFIATNTIIGIFDPRIEWDCRDNTLIRAGSETLYIRPANSTNYSGPVIHLDFSHNWWGTSDPDEISAWIYDYNDDQEFHYIVDFEPMNDVVATEAHSWSSIKSLFDGDGVGDGEE